MLILTVCDISLICAIETVPWTETQTIGQFHSLILFIFIQTHIVFCPSNQEKKYIILLSNITVSKKGTSVIKQFNSYLTIKQCIYTILTALSWW